MVSLSITVFFVVASIYVANSSAVTEVTTSTLSSVLSEDVVLLEFYAPWCSACKQFEPIYEYVAGDLTQQGIFVGRVDVTANQALAARFEIQAIPTIFYFKDRKVYQYEGPLSTSSVISFVKNTYKKSEPLPYWHSPMGPIGIFKATIIQFGVSLMDLQPYLVNQFGVSPFVAFIATIGCAILTIATVVLSSIYVSVYYLKL